jgi:hypothetical protein
MANHQKANLHFWPSAIVMLSIAFAAVSYVTSRRSSFRELTGADAVLATVNGEKITQRDAENFSSLPVSDFLGMLVDFRLLDQAAAKDRISVSDADLAERERNLLRGSKAASLDSLASQMNRTPAGLASQVRHAALLETLASRQMKPIPLSMIHCRGVFIKSGGPHARGRQEALRLAKSVQKRLESGASAAGLARKYSDDAPSRARGGDLGVCQDLIPQQLAITDHKLFLALDAAGRGESLKTPVDGEGGYWAIQVVSTQKHPKGDDAAYEPVRKLWRSMWVQRYEPLVINRLRNAAKIDPPLVRGSRSP